MKKLLLIATIAFGLCQASASTAEAKLTDSLRLARAQQRSLRQQERAQRRALKNAGRNQNRFIVSPSITDVFNMNATVFTEIKNAYDTLGFLNRNDVRNIVRRIVRRNFKIHSPQARREFRRNNGRSMRGVIQDYLDWIFKGGVMPVYV